MGSNEESDSLFDKIKFTDRPEAHALINAFNEDLSPEKVILGLAEYRTDEGASWVMPVVQSLEKQMAIDTTLNHEYLPIGGQFDFRLAGIRLLFGKDNPAVIQNKVDAVQTVGSSGAIRLGLEFLHQQLHCNTLYISKPFWGNVCNIAKSLHLKVKDYRYWNSELCSFDVAGMMEDLKAVPNFSVIMLSMCAHNPTGCDLNMGEWKKIADILKRKKVCLFFDCSFQGLSSGDLDIDAEPLRLFVKEGFELFAVQSFEANFGLYDEGVAQLIFVANQSENLLRISSQLTSLIYHTWNSPPLHGGRIVSTVLNNPALSTEWRENVQAMALNLQSLRQLFYFKLKAVGVPGNWDHIIQQKGIFCCVGLNLFQCEFLQQHHIYMTRNGCINISGITSTNIDYIVSTIYKAVTNVQTRVA